MSTLGADPLAGPLSAADFAAVRSLTRLFGPWTQTPRRRRLLFLGLASPGFIGVFSTPLHQSLALLVVSSLLFLAAVVFRARTEPLLLRAEAAALWPPPPKETLHV